MVLLNRDTVLNPNAIKEAETLRRATEAIRNEESKSGGFLKRHK